MDVRKAIRQLCETMGYEWGPDQEARIGRPRSPAKKREPKPRARDPIWDAVCAEWGLSPERPSEKTRVGRLVRDLKIKGAAPDDIAAVRERYVAEWPEAADTPEAILKHWDRFSHVPSVAGLGDSRELTPEEKALLFGNGGK